jgi:hypothetical protein
LLEYKNGHLPQWPKFRIQGDIIVTPNGQDVHKNQVELFWWLVQLKTSGLHFSDPMYVEFIHSRISNCATEPSSTTPAGVAVMPAETQPNALEA